MAITSSCSTIPGPFRFEKLKFTWTVDGVVKIVNDNPLTIFGMKYFSLWGKFHFCLLYECANGNKKTLHPEISVQCGLYLSFSLLSTIGLDHAAERNTLASEIIDLMRIENRQARYDYEILEKFEAGIDLLGPEVKSVREGKMSLNEAFVHIRDGQAHLINAHIHPYQNSIQSISPTRSRKLLLHKRELISLASRAATSGLTLIPLSVYNKGNIIKIEIGLGKGKKKWDKRQQLKRRAQQREIEQALRGKQWG